ncbi:MAG: hemerythrin [Nitrospirae bacterium]|nr:MAG: hemerythrin [Nitrospirota bacterium]
MGLFDWILKRNRSDMRIPWSDKFSVGVTEIDSQHKKLFSLYNNLVDAMYEGETMGKLQETLDKLIEYVVFHFTTEENYMKKYNYPEYEDHKKMHVYLRDKTLDIHRDFSEGKPVLTADVVDFLKKWLTEHVINVDKKLGKFLKKAGAK